MDAAISVWTSCVDLPNFAPMPLGLKTDVLIIGGGMAGILCAYYLKQVGVQCSLVEAKTVCSGVTENTTAKITSQHGLIYHKLLKEFGPEKAKQYYCANEQAVEQYRLLSQRYDFSWEEKNNYVYSRDNFQKLYKELEALQSLKIPAQYQKSLPLPFRVAGAVEFPHQAQMNPLKLVNALLEDLTVYEHTRALEINGSQVVTDRGKIQAEHVIVATHFPFLNLHGSYVLKLYQHRSYVLALEHGPQIGGMYVDEAQTGLSFRNAGTYLLLGGGGHRTGKQSGAWRQLREFAGRHYPDAQERCHWAAQDCMSLDGVPYIGRYCAKTPNVYVATGFQKWGMTSSMVAAQLLRDMILGADNEYEALFSPQRTMLRPQLAANAISAAVNLLTPTAPRCPHMGCALTWNKQERSWDCPCHGSRFDEAGQLLDNPATGDLKKTPQPKKIG